MSDTLKPETTEPWRQVHRAFLGRLKGLLADPAGLVAALGGRTVEQLVNQVLAESCAQQGIEVTAFFAGFEPDRTAQRQVDTVIRSLLQTPAVMELRRPALLADLRREVALLEYALSGDEPPASLWEGIDPAEQVRIRHTASTMRDTDPVLLARVRKALGRGEGFGTCEACGKAIPVGRLQLVAAAERCAPCQAQLEGAEAPPAPIVALTWFNPRPAPPPGP